MSTRPPQNRAQHVSTAMSVLADLQDALRAAGVTLPFLALHHSTWSSNDESPGLTKLSACPFGTARQLTAALPKGTS